jgi:cell division septal protein FtsQ
MLLVAMVAGYALESWPGFRPKHVRVTGNIVVPTSEILAQAHIDRRRNMWLLSAGAMARRIEEIPYVLSAHVHRIPPASITIAITERHPFAVVRSGDESALVDSQLRVLESADDAGALPTIVLTPPVALEPGIFLTQPAAATMRSALLSLRAHDVSVEEIDDNNGDVSALLSGGVRVLLGDEANVHAAIPLIEPILTRFALLGRFVQTLDLRSPTTPVATERFGERATASKRARPRHRSPCRPGRCPSTLRA